MKFLKVGLILLSVFLVSCATDPKQEVVRTWNQATVFSPTNDSPTSISSFKPEKKYPIVLYFHGCTGISNANDKAWGKFLSSRGFVVVMPDSFVRSYRYLGCDPKSKKLGNDSKVGWLRVDEVLFAVQQAKQLPWSNGKIYLMGHSEGAWAVSMYSGDDISGVVFSSLRCVLSISNSPNVPVLRIGYKSDPWNPMPIENCAEQINRNNYVKAYVDGVEHETFYSDALKKQVADFLETLSR